MMNWFCVWHFTLTGQQQLKNGGVLKVVHPNNSNVQFSLGFHPYVGTRSSSNLERLLDAWNPGNPTFEKEVTEVKEKAVDKVRRAQKPVPKLDSSC